MARFLSEKWLKDCRRALAESDDFAREARSFSGDLVFVFEADDGLPETRRLFLSIEKGACDEACFLNGGPVPDADYRISAPYSLWISMIRGEEDAFSAFTTRKVKVKGNLMRLMMNTGAAVALVRALAGVPVDFD